MLGSLHSLIAYMLHSTIYQPVQQVPLLVSPRPPQLLHQVDSHTNQESVLLANNSELDVHNSELDVHSFHAAT